MLLSPPTATSPRVSSELEQARPQTSGEEELQLQLALAMSREVAEQVSARVGFPHVHAFIVTTTCLSLQWQLGFAPGGIGGEKKKKKAVLEDVALSFFLFSYCSFKFLF